MSTFATFLTNGPSSGRHRHGKVDFRQKFLRESNKYFPKPIKPRVNVNPIVGYMTNQESRIQEQEQRTMKYQNCSQIVPTVGLSNLIFYDCHKKAAAEMSRLDESISKLEEPPSSMANEDRYRYSFFEQEIITESTRHDADFVVTSNRQDWTSSHFDGFVRDSQTFRDRPIQDFTFASNAKSSLLSSDIDSYASYEMDYSRQAYDRDAVMPHPALDLFEIDLNQQTSQFQTEPTDPFNMNVTGQSDQNIRIMDTSLLNAAGFDSLINSSDWHMKSSVSQSNDETMAKFAISSCSDNSFADIDRNDFYVDFIPLHTSTPKAARIKANSRNDVDSELDEVSALLPLISTDIAADLLNVTDEEVFFNQQTQNGARSDFPFYGTKLCLAIYNKLETHTPSYHHCALFESQTFRY